MPSLKEKPKPFLVPEYCKGCGRCVSVCVKGCIAFSDEINPTTGIVPVILDLEKCTGCGLCIDACPEPYGLRALQAGEAYELQDPAKLFGAKRGRSPRAGGHPRPASAPAQDPAADHQGQLRRRRGCPAGRLPPLLRLPHHPLHRGRRADGQAAAQAGRRLPPGGLRSRHREPHVRHRRRRHRQHDLHLRPRLLPDAGRRLLHDRRRSARRVREHHARRPRPGQHRPRAVRREAGLPRPGPRPHPRHHPHAQHAPGDARLLHPGLRAELQVPQPRRSSWPTATWAR